MIAIHKKYKILSRGSLKFLWNDYQGLCYGQIFPYRADDRDPEQQR